MIMGLRDCLDAKIYVLGKKSGHDALDPSSLYPNGLSSTHCERTRGLQGGKCQGLMPDLLTGEDKNYPFGPTKRGYPSAIEQRCAS